MSRNPADELTWQDAQDYVRWLAQKTGKPYRLLSRNEWEYAARGGTETLYWWGDDFSAGKEVCQGCRPVIAEGVKGEAFGQEVIMGRTYGFVSPIPQSDQYTEANPFGLFNMLGNVSEWTLDCLGPNTAYSVRDTHNAKEYVGNNVCGYRMFCGGHFKSRPNDITPSRCMGIRPDYAGDKRAAIGLRVALDYQ